MPPTRAMLDDETRVVRDRVVRPWPRFAAGAAFVQFAVLCFAIAHPQPTNGRGDGGDPCHAAVAVGLDVVLLALAFHLGQRRGRRRGRTIGGSGSGTVTAGEVISGLLLAAMYVLDRPTAMAAVYILLPYAIAVVVSAARAVAVRARHAHAVVMGTRLNPGSGWSGCFS